MQVKDRVLIGPNILFGNVVISSKTLLSCAHTTYIEAPLVKERHASFVNGALSFELRLTQIDMNDAEHLPPAIPHTYFPVHRDCRVTFYQDAHQVPGGVPAVPVPTCAEMPDPETLHTFAILSRYTLSLVQIF
jgi:hypothetical protein